MIDRLAAFVRRELGTPVSPLVADVAERLAAAPGAVAVLFYGSNLRTGAIDGVLDFYVLTQGAPERGLWPRVGYRELPAGGDTIRAKIATMRLATFAKAAAAGTIDTTIWTRFVQPARLVWARDDAVAAAVGAEIAAAAVSAARFAAALGPGEGAPQAFWQALFRETYAAELRVERAGRSDAIVGHHAARYDALLPLAWRAGGLRFADTGGIVRPILDDAERTRLRRAWRLRRAAGKPLNVVRLIKAAFTFDGAARYGAWKIERHTGIAVPLTAWRERHPILAAPGVLWRVWRARAKTA